MAHPYPTADASLPSVHPAIAIAGVLLVEDCSVHRSIAAQLLQEAGIERIHEADDGIDALALLARLDPPPALIVLDLNLPNMDGIEILRELARQPEPPAVLVFSGSDAAVLDSIHSLSREFGLQCLGAVAKPVSVAGFREALARYAPRSARRNHDPLEEVSEAELIAALRLDLITAHYQPKVDLRTGQALGLEALARWRQADGTMIPPIRFIGVAERCNLIDALTRRMLDAVLLDLAAWKVAGFEPKVAINVSCRSLSQADFTEGLLRSVEAAGIAKESITFEVTESAVANDPATALGSIGRLRMRGFGVSIDDYGTGFSSLQQLSRMPFNELKIDRSFVVQASDSQRQRTILASAIDVGRRLGMSTVAEGIETAAQLAIVSGLGCDVGQGYLFGKPMPPQDVLPWRDAEGARVAAQCAEALAA